MSGITSQSGLISGINSAQIIDQLISVEGRPRVLAQRRIVELQGQQASFLDISSRVSALRTAAQAFRVNKVFQSTGAVTSDSNVLNATASSGAAAGNYSFIVDRVVTTQQSLTRAFSDRNNSAIGLTSLTVESTKARLDTDTELAQLNGGDGISRGKIVVTDSSGKSATIDLSRSATINDVLKSINNNTDVRVRASVDEGRLVIKDLAGGTGQPKVASAAGFTTAESLGLAKTGVSGTISGDLVYRLGDSTSIQSLNDGNGIRFNTAGGTVNEDFTVRTRDGSVFKIDLGDQYNSKQEKIAGPATSIAAVRDRIKTQTGGKVDLQIRDDGRGLKLLDNTTGSTNPFSVTDTSGAAADLGLLETSVDDVVTGKAIFAGLNSTLASSLRGGAGITNGTFTIQNRAGNPFTFTIDTSQSVSTILKNIGQATGGTVTAALNDKGNAIVLTDNTGATNELIVSGDGAVALGLATAPAGVNSSTVSGSRIQRQYVTGATQVSTLNGGTGIGTGTFDIVGVTGKKATINIGSSVRTVADVLQQINGATSETGIRARINDSGSGILLEKAPGITGATKLSVTDTSGTVARFLNLAGEAKDATTNNFIDGSYRKTIDIAAGDTLDQIVTKIGAARSGITANVISDGSAVNPYRLRLTSNQAGRDGRFILETGGADIGLSTIAEGENSRVFVGADDPAKAILVTRSSNSITGVIDNVTIDLKSVSDKPVQVTVARDSAAIETAANTFITSFNTLAARLKTLTAYDATTQKKGTLLGDSTATSLRSELFNAVNRKAQGVSGQYQYLSQVGITIAKDNQLTLDATKLRAAIDKDPQGVADLFAAQVQTNTGTTVPIPGIPGVTTNNTGRPVYSQLGVAEIIADVADRYTNSVSGTLTQRNKSYDDQIEFQNSRIARFDVQLASRRRTLEAQFAGLETTLANLQRQQSAITGIRST